MHKAKPMQLCVHITQLNLLQCRKLIYVCVCVCVYVCVCVCVCKSICWILFTFLLGIGCYASSLRHECVCNTDHYTTTIRRSRCHIFSHILQREIIIKPYHSIVPIYDHIFQSKTTNCIPVPCQNRWMCESQMIDKMLTVTCYDTEAGYQCSLI